MIRAHMIVSSRDSRYGNTYPEYNIFRDQSLTADEETYIDALPPTQQVPTMDRIVRFYMDIYTKSQMESECIIMSLIYMERLIKSTKGKLKIKYYPTPCLQPCDSSTMIFAFCSGSTTGDRLF